MATATYVCSNCRAEQTRDYRVTHFIKSCETGCGFIRHIRKELVEKALQVPADARPDSWGSMNPDEKVEVAMKEGVITRADLLH